MSATNDTTQKGGEFSFLPERTCAICYQDQNSAKSEAELLAAASSSSGVVGSAQTDVTNPYETIPCGCVYCFVCLATRIEREEGEGWTCLRCGELVKECKPWSGDVLSPAEAHAANNGGRNVAFAAGVKERPDLNRLSTESGRRSSSNRVSFDDEVRERRRVSFEDEIRPGEDAASDDGPVRVPERRETLTTRSVGTESEGETSTKGADEDEEEEDDENEEGEEEDEEDETQSSGDVQTSTDAEEEEEEEEDDEEEEEEEGSGSGSESGSDGSDSEDYEAEEEELGEDLAY